MGRRLHQGASRSRSRSARQNVEKGLHTLSGDDVAAGGRRLRRLRPRRQRAGRESCSSSIPTSCPTRPTPIEITAVVRRNEANDNAGFKLVYESTNGFKTAGGWYTVPDNKQWHTVTWKIDDPQFVNYWGYNFTLESDGNKFNKYYIQSVTVTKR